MLLGALQVFAVPTTHNITAVASVNNGTIAAITIASFGAAVNASSAIFSAFVPLIDGEYLVAIQTTNASALNVVILLDGALYTSSTSTPVYPALTWNVTAQSGYAYWYSDTDVSSDAKNVWLPAVNCNTSANPTNLNGLALKYNAAWVGNRVSPSISSCNASAASTLYWLARVNMRTIITAVFAGSSTYEVSIGGKLFVGPRDIPSASAASWSGAKASQLTRAYTMEVEWSVTDVIVAVHVSALNNTVFGLAGHIAVNGVIVMITGQNATSSSNTSPSATWLSDIPDAPYSTAPWMTASVCSGSVQTAMSGTQSFSIGTLSAPTIAPKWIGYNDTSCMSNYGNQDIYYRFHVPIVHS